MSPSSTTNAQHKKILAALATAEAGVFRIGQVARQLITEHPALRALSYDAAEIRRYAEVTA